MDIFTPAQLGCFAAIMLAAAGLQSSIGFAAGLLSVPLLHMAGATPPQAIVISLVGSAVQTLFGAYRLRRLIAMRRFIRPAIIRTIALPVGVYTLWNVSTVDPELITQIIGGVILLFVILQWTWNVRPRDQVSAAWEWLAFAVSGFTLGLVGMGGPPVVLWVMAHRWSSRRTRAFLFFIFLTGMIPQGALLYVAFGDSALAAAGVGLLLIPFILVGTWAGLTVGDRISRPLLRRIAYGVLLLIGTSAFAAPLWK